VPHGPFSSLTVFTPVFPSPGNYYILPYRQALIECPYKTWKTNLIYDSQIHEWIQIGFLIKFVVIEGYFRTLFCVHIMFLKESNSFNQEYSKNSNIVKYNYN